MDEKNRYIRGIISWLGFKSIAVPFVERKVCRNNQVSTQENAQVCKRCNNILFSQALETSNIFWILLSFASFAYLIVTIILKVFSIIQTVPGWASIVAINLFFNGIIPVNSRNHWRVYWQDLR